MELHECPENHKLRLEKSLQIFIDKLEVMVYDIKDELSLKRQLREEWVHWHELWKNAWLISDNDLYSLEQKLELREKTSVKKRI